VPLKRVLGPVDAAWLVAGNMIGAGIFVMPGLVAARLSGFALPLSAWAIGGVLALAGAAVYGELGARNPHAGGEYLYLARTFGPVWGFLSGWAGGLLTFSAAAAVMATVSVRNLATAFPALELPEIVERALAPLFVLVLTWTNTVGARAGGRTTVLFTAVLLIGLIALFGAGLLSGSAEVHLPVASPSSEPWPQAMGAAMIFVYFTYSGWNAAAYLAGEIRDPGRNLAWGLLGGTALVTVVYVLFNIVLLLTVPAEQFAGSTTAAAQAANILLGPRAEQALALIIAVAVLGSANVTLMAGARVYYAMARDGLAPRPLATINSAGVPAAALWAGGIWTALLATLGWVETLVNWATLAILLLSSMAAGALFVLRRRDGPEAPFRCPGYPWTPAVYLLASLGVAYSSAVYAPLQALYGVLLVLAGLPVYFVFRRYAGTAGSP
jgi:APA family basic amino acid/polyamine antiporter